MPVRVVIPREIVQVQAKGVLRAAKARGFEGRVVPGAAPGGWVRVEFLILVYSKSPAVLEAFEIELDDVLHGLKTRRGFHSEEVRSSGTGSWIEPA